jgi:hypothetical protein
MHNSIRVLCTIITCYTKLIFLSCALRALACPTCWTIHNSVCVFWSKASHWKFVLLPTLKLRLLKLEKDPAWFYLREGQPIDASQKKWTTGASHLTLSLETSTNLNGTPSSNGMTSGLWRCVELQDVSVEVKNLKI